MSILDRGAFTDLVLSWLRAGTLLVGDNIAPYEGGWLKGQPGDGGFVEYCVLSAGRVSAHPSRLCPGSRDYTLTYTLSSFTESRRSLDLLAHRGRLELVGKSKTIHVGYKITDVKVSSYGRIVRDDVTSPPLWSESDEIVLECTPSGN